MQRIFNRFNQKATRRALRQQPVTAEILLWRRIRNRQLNGLKFRRQYSVGPFVIDFYCPEVRLAIELDGITHYLGNAQTRDAWREKLIAQFGIRFLRFTNDKILSNLEGVLQVIVDHLKGNPPHPTSPQRGEVVDLPPRLLLVK